MRILADVFLCEEEDAGRWRVRVVLLKVGFEAGCEVTEAEMAEEGFGRRGKVFRRGEHALLESEGRVLSIDEVELKV